MAAVLLEEALRITTGRGCRLVERMAAAQAAHRVRGDLADRSALLGVQRELAAALEALGEPAAALEVATAALEDWPPGSSAGDRDWLAAGPPRSWTGTGRRGRAGPAPTTIRPKKLKSEFNSRGRAGKTQLCSVRTLAGELCTCSANDRFPDSYAGWQGHLRWPGGWIRLAFRRPPIPAPRGVDLHGVRPRRWPWLRRP